MEFKIHLTERELTEAVADYILKKTGRVLKAVSFQKKCTKTDLRGDPEDWESSAIVTAE